MTRDKLLALAKRTSTKNGFKVITREIWKRARRNSPVTATTIATRGQVKAWQVVLDSDVGFPGAQPVLLTTENQATACEARDRYWVWLHKEGLTRG